MLFLCTFLFSRNLYNSFPNTKIWENKKYKLLKYEKTYDIVRSIVIKYYLQKSIINGRTEMVLEPKVYLR